MVRKRRKRVRKRTGGYEVCEPEEESAKKMSKPGKKWKTGGQSAGTGEKVENRGTKCRDREESGKTGKEVSGSGEKWRNRE